MEVHHHSHTSRKKWTHYFWEFLMLFLAVTLGFFVENQREHYVESIREKKYIQSIMADLKSDTASFNYGLKRLRNTIRVFDTVIHMLKTYNNNEETNRKLYSLVRLHNTSVTPVKHSYTAFEQMRNSGNLRLIRNQNIIDSINLYYFYARDIERLNDIQEERYRAKVDLEGKVFDGQVFQSMVDVENFSFKPPSGNPLLVTSDKAVLNNFIVKTHYLVTVMLYSERFIKNQQTRAIRLINFLEKEYNIKLN